MKTTHFRKLEKEILFLKIYIVLPHAHLHNLGVLSSQIVMSKHTDYKKVFPNIKRNAYVRVISAFEVYMMDVVRNSFYLEETCFILISLCSSVRRTTCYSQLQTFGARYLTKKCVEYKAVDLRST